MKIAVYCGASTGKNRYMEATKALGNWMVQEGHDLVYGGGKTGLMGVIADTVLAGGRQSIGVIPRFLKEREIAHDGLTHLEIVETMSERKERMFILADAFVALPGGPGTLEEITEVISWVRLKRKDAKCILFNTAGYYNSLKAQFETMIVEGFLEPEDITNVLFTDDLNQMRKFLEQKTYRDSFLQL